MAKPPLGRRRRSVGEFSTFPQARRRFFPLPPYRRSRPTIGSIGSARDHASGIGGARADVQVVQSCGGLRFTIEPLSSFLVFEKVSSLELERNRALELEVLGLIDDTHAALPEFFGDLVVADGGADYDGPVLAPTVSRTDAVRCARTWRSEKRPKGLSPAAEQSADTVSALSNRPGIFAPPIQFKGE